MTSTDNSSQYDADPQIEARVRELYLQRIGLDGMSPEQQEQAIREEAVRLTAMADELMGDTAHGPLMADWRAKHPGQDPDYQTIVALEATARNSAVQQILETELFPQLDLETREAAITERSVLMAAADAQAARLRALGDPDRWKTHQVILTPLAQEILDRVWGSAGSFETRMLLLSLIQQRLEDNQPVPDTAAHPLTEQFEEMVARELATRPKDATPF